MDELETIKPPERSASDDKDKKEDKKDDKKFDKSKKLFSFGTLGTEEINLGFKFKIRKKLLLYIILPIVVLGLLLFGLIQQGIVGDWLSVFKKASATLTVMDAQNTAIDNAQIIIGGVTGTTDLQGIATLNDLESGVKTLTIRKTGFIAINQDVTLKRGQNNLGTYKMSEEPGKKVNLSLTVIHYVSNQPITDATISLDDLKPNLEGKLWKFTDVPIGDYTLTVTDSGFNTYSTPVTVDEKTTDLEPVNLVPTGTVVFETNREQGKRAIYTASYDGSNQKPLIARVGENEDFSPALGPNQKKVFFYSTRDGAKLPDGSDKVALYLVNLNGDNLIKINDDTSAYDAKWSGDGGIIAYRTRYVTGTGSLLRLYNVVTKANTAFDAYNNFDGYTLSSDGNYVAFSATDSSTQKVGIFLSKTDGSGLVVVEDWKDGQSLEFTPDNSLRYSYYFNNKWQTFEYNLQSKQKTEIKNLAVDKLSGTVLSPDKKYRAYVSTRDGKTNLFISDPNGKNEVQLTDLHFVQNGDILWSLDSTFLMFNVVMPGESARYLVSIDGLAQAKKIVDINTYGWYGN